jgi:CheY-like chemotaxis protein
MRSLGERANRPAGGREAWGGAIRAKTVDDRGAVRVGLGGLLEVHADAELVATAASAREALADGPRLSPDLAVVDYHLGDGDGRRLRRAVQRLPRPPRAVPLSPPGPGEPSPEAAAGRT